MQAQRASKQTMSGSRTTMRCITGVPSSPQPLRPFSAQCTSLEELFLDTRSLVACYLPTLFLLLLLLLASRTVNAPQSTAVLTPLAHISICVASEPLPTRLTGPIRNHDNSAGHHWRALTPTPLRVWVAHRGQGLPQTCCAAALSAS